MWIAVKNTVLYVFFWVFPRRPIVVCRRFGTLYQFHLQRLDVHLHPALEDGTDRGFRNVGKPQSDAGEIPKRIYTIFKTRRKFEIKKNTIVPHSSVFPTIFNRYTFVTDIPHSFTNDELPAGEPHI